MSEQSTAKRSVALVATLLIANFIFSSKVCFAQNGSSGWDLDEILAMGNKACVALDTLNKNAEKPITFDFKLISALGNLSDAYLILGKSEKAKELLEINLPPEDANRLVATTGVKFRGTIPELPGNLTPAKKRMWQLEILVSLAHGRHFQKALSFAQKIKPDLSSPNAHLRNLKLIAERCREAKDETWSKKAASSIWKALGDVPKGELEIRLNYGIYLLELSEDFRLYDSAEKVFSKIESDVATLRQPNELDPEQKYNLLKRLGAVCSRLKKYELADELLRLATKTILEVEDDYFDALLANSKMDLEMAKHHRRKKEMAASLKYSQSAWNRLQMAINAQDDLETAKSIDGGKGFFTAVLAFSQFSELKDVIVEQVKSGQIDQAIKNWQAMPDSIQKYQTQIEWAKHGPEKGKAEATQWINDCVKRCDDLIPENGSLIDVLPPIMSSIVILHHAEQTELRDKRVAQLVELASRSEDTDAKSALAQDLIALKLFRASRQVIDLIETESARALPLSSLAKSIAISHQPSPK